MCILVFRPGGLASLAGEGDTVVLFSQGGAGRFDIGLPGTRSGRDRGLPHLRLETISARNGPCPVPRKHPPESSVPGENLPRGSRRNQLRRGHGSPPVLSEVPHELSTDAHSKECKRSPQQFIPAGFPPHDNLQPGTEDSASLLTTPDMVRSGRVLLTSVKSPFINCKFFIVAFSDKI